MTTHRRPPPEGRFEILLVEDNSTYVRLVQEAFAVTATEITLSPIPDGEAAIQELKERLIDPDVRLPDLVIVDLELPGRDGCEVIEAIRGDPKLRRLPVIMFTSSSASADVVRSYDSGANAYLTKPDRFEELLSRVEAIEVFWFEAARLPYGSS